MIEDKNKELIERMEYFKIKYKYSQLEKERLKKEYDIKRRRAMETEISTLKYKYENIIENYNKKLDELRSFENDYEDVIDDERTRIVHNYNIKLNKLKIEKVNENDHLNVLKMKKDYFNDQIKRTIERKRKFSTDLISNEQEMTNLSKKDDEQQRITNFNQLVLWDCKEMEQLLNYRNNEFNKNSLIVKNKQNYHQLNEKNKTLRTELENLKFEKKKKNRSICAISDKSYWLNVKVKILNKQLAQLETQTNEQNNANEQIFKTLKEIISNYQSIGTNDKTANSIYKNIIKHIPNEKFVFTTTLKWRADNSFLNKRKKRTLINIKKKQNLIKYLTQLHHKYKDDMIAENRDRDDNININKNKNNNNNNNNYNANINKIKKLEYLSEEGLQAICACLCYSLETKLKNNKIHNK
jgi:hypothetical protein